MDASRYWSHGEEQERTDKHSDGRRKTGRIGFMPFPLKAVPHQIAFVLIQVLATEPVLTWLVDFPVEKDVILSRGVVRKLLLDCLMWAKLN